MVLDTNFIIRQIRLQSDLPARAIIPIVVVGELEAFALKADWGYQKLLAVETMLNKFPVVDIDRDLTRIYAQVDAYSQGKLKNRPLPVGLSARNMSKNDIWIAATALYFDLELCTTDHDFDHLVNFGLRLAQE